MSRKMRVIIKRPDEQYGHVCNISNSLENLQKTVDGYIETHEITRSCDGKPIIMVCNEEGKLRNLPHNFYLWNDEIVGTIFLCSADGDELSDLPVTFGLAEWKKILTEMRWK
jgi:hypothetical protein